MKRNIEALRERAHRLGVARRIDPKSMIDVTDRETHAERIRAARQRRCERDGISAAGTRHQH